MAFFCKLIPPRTTFAQDMSQAEALLMEKHAAYWHGLMSRGRVVAFGLVADPAAAFGVGIVEVETGDEVRALTANDPTIRSGRGFHFEVHPMPFGVVHPPG
jgi:hypothetical protein